MWAAFCISLPEGVFLPIEHAGLSVGLARYSGELTLQRVKGIGNLNTSFLSSQWDSGMSPHSPVSYSAF